MTQITFQPIGYIVSPFKTIEEIPKQSIFASEKTATIELDPKYEKGLQNLEEYDHIIVQFHFHKSMDFDLLTLTPWSDDLKGVFSTRSPRRPNPIGISIVKVLDIRDNIIEIQGVDMLDGTPVIDIKPYVAKLNPDT
jgi:tRNA-Thr(GGU) m(6)t(6)A37 methyltransferase TsaA